jgi:asparagine synthase (glutamine-hydrolysing)
LPVLSRFSVAELKNYTQNVLLEDADQMSMANSIELRVPFLDKDLVEYVLGVPDKYKYPTTPKKLLVDSLYPLIPDEIVNRPKMGFSFPWELWMRNELKSFCEERIYRLSQRNLFNPDVIISMWKSFIAGNKNVQWFKIWLLVVLEHWLERNGVS